MPSAVAVVRGQHADQDADSPGRPLIPATASAIRGDVHPSFDGAGGGVPGQLRRRRWRLVGHAGAIVAKRRPGGRSATRVGGTADAAQMAEMVMVVAAVSSATTSDTHWFPDDENDAPSVTGGRGLVMWMPPPMIEAAGAEHAARVIGRAPPGAVLVELVIE